MDRRKFIIRTSKGILASSVLSWPLSSIPTADLTKITILHTNDMHSRIDPFPMDGSERAGKGGMVKRAMMIENLRAQEPNVILLDAGDIFQGTPYFNLYEGEIEFKLMSKMGYDVATLGNHDFDLGLEGLKKQLPHASFDFVSANYDFSDTILNDHFAPYKIIEKEGIKIGVLGVGIELKGLVAERLYGNTRYYNPIAMANKYASRLKQDLDCKFVICLSHLGYKYEHQKISDHTLAKYSSDIDLIIGGHTHTFLNEPKKIKNQVGKEVYINQVGFGGLMLGRFDLYFEKSNSKSCLHCKNLRL